NAPSPATHVGPSFHVYAKEKLPQTFLVDVTIGAGKGPIGQEGRPGGVLPLPAAPPAPPLPVAPPSLRPPIPEAPAPPPPPVLSPPRPPDMPPLPAPSPPAPPPAPPVAPSPPVAIAPPVRVMTGAPPLPGGVIPPVPEL